jgi:small-conductance mechanosensitive channel
MLATMKDLLQRAGDAWALLPDGVASWLILALAAVIALAVHKVAVLLLRPLLDERHPYLRALLRATNAPARLALLVLALFIVLPSASFDDDTRMLLERLLSVATTVLLGWIAITAGHLAGELYLVRYQREDQDILVVRKHVTQVRVLRHVVDLLIVLLTVGAAMMTFEPVRQFGVSLFASAGVAGLVAGLAARPMLSNLIAGIQIATTQPIRIDDEVVIEGQWGRIEEITSTYVVIGLWDLRQLIVPLSYFIEKPFENWTRDSTDLIGAVSFHLDYMAPVERVRAKVMEIVNASPLWDHKIAKLQVFDAKEFSLELRVLVSARTSGAVSELRLEVREQVIAFLQRECPSCLPRLSSAEHAYRAGSPVVDGNPATVHPSP